MENRVAGIIYRPTVLSPRYSDLQVEGFMLSIKCPNKPSVDIKNRQRIIGKI